MSIKNILFSLCALCLLSGCFDDQSKDEKASNDRLVVAVSGDMPPFEFHITDQGQDQIVGFDIDLIHMVSQELGKTIEIKDMDFNAIIPSLHSGRADLAISSMTPTEERMKSVAFSDAYYGAVVGVLSKDMTGEISADNLVGKRIGVQLGSSHEFVLKQIKADGHDFEIVSLNKLGELVQDLKVGRIQAVIMEVVTAEKFIEANPEISLSNLKGYDVGFAIALPKESKWLDPVNAALKKLKESGKIAPLVEKWLKPKTQ